LHLPQPDQPSPKPEECHRALGSTLASAKAEMDAAAKAAQEEARKKAEERKKKAGEKLADNSATPTPAQSASHASDRVPGLLFCLTGHKKTRSLHKRPAQHPADF